MNGTAAVTPRFRACVDTCVISARVKGELSDTECVAVDRLIQSFATGAIELSRSKHVDAEIAAIPDAYRAPHEALLSTFMLVPAVEVGGLTRPTGLGLPGANPRRMLWNRLRAVLRDEGDRSHVFTAAQNRLRYLVTIDQRTILNQQAAVQAASGVLPLLPSAFLKVVESPSSHDGA